MSNQSQTQVIEDKAVAKSLGFKPIYVMRAFAVLGDQLLLFTIPVTIYAVTGSVSKSGAAFFIEWFPRIFFAPFIGSLLDRILPTRVLKVSDFTRALVTLAVASLCFFLPEKTALPILMVMTGLLGALFQSSYISVESIIRSRATHEELPGVQASVQSLEQFATILGPMLGAMLLTVLGWKGVIAVAGFFFLFGAVIFQIFSRDYANAEPLHTKLRPGKNFFTATLQGVSQGFKIVFTNPILWRVTLLTTFVNFIFGAALATGAPIISGAFHLEEKYFGILLSIAGLASALILAITARITKRVSTTQLGLFSFALICAGGLGAALGSSFPIYCFSIALVLGFDGMFNVYIRTVRARAVESHEFNKALGAIILLNSCSIPLTGLIMSLTAQFMSPQKIILYLTAFSLAGGAMLIPGLLRGKRI